MIIAICILFAYCGLLTLLALSAFGHASILEQRLNALIEKHNSMVDAVLKVADAHNGLLDVLTGQVPKATVLNKEDLQ